MSLLKFIICIKFLGFCLNIFDLHRDVPKVLLLGKNRKELPAEVELVKSIELRVERADPGECRIDKIN